MFLSESVSEVTSGSFFFGPKLREKCPYLELFWPVFSRIRPEYGEILRISPYLVRISPYSVRMRENVDQSNSEDGHFLPSAKSSSLEQQV